LTGVRCSEVIYVAKAVIETSKWWLLWTGGCYSEVVVSSGLTVFRSILKWFKAEINLFFLYVNKIFTRLILIITKQYENGKEKFFNHHIPLVIAGIDKLQPEDVDLRIGQASDDRFDL
jgi:hypothetical protein